MSEHADAVVYPIRVLVSTPCHRVLVPPGRANPLHRCPRRSPLNRCATRRRRPRLTVPPDATVYAHELVPHRHPRVGEARHDFPGHLPCAGEVADVVQACRAARTLTSAELGQAVGRTRYAGRGRAGPGWAACAAQAGCAGTVELGRARIWPSDIFLYIFIFSEYIQFLANSKICVGFI
jgi:hypothetical protein